MIIIIWLIISEWLLFWYHLPVYNNDIGKWMDKSGDSETTAISYFF